MSDATRVPNPTAEPCAGCKVPTLGRFGWSEEGPHLTPLCPECWELVAEAPPLSDEAVARLAAQLVADTDPQRDWYCYAEAVGYQSHCSPDRQTHSPTYCGWADEGYGGTAAVAEAGR